MENIISIRLSILVVFTFVLMSLMGCGTQVQLEEDPTDPVEVEVSRNGQSQFGQDPGVNREQLLGAGFGFLNQSKSKVSSSGLYTQIKELGQIQVQRLSQGNYEEHSGSLKTGTQVLDYSQIKYQEYEELTEVVFHFTSSEDNKLISGKVSLTFVRDQSGNWRTNSAIIDQTTGSFLF